MKHPGKHRTLVNCLISAALLFSSIFAMNGLRDANLGFFAFLVLIISIPWCLLNVLTEVPNTNAMKLLSIVILFIIAIIDQILTTSKR